MSEKYELAMAVRDYECDLQGVVNNAVYQNYLEHARHEFLKSRNIDFAALAKTGTNLMVIRAELDYKGSLVSGDEFMVVTGFEQESRLKFVFIQQIVHLETKKEVLAARVTGVALNKKGRPFSPPELVHLK